MNYINFFCMSFCLFLSIFTFCPSKMKDNSWGWLNPLKQKETYVDEHGKFTLAKAKKAIEVSKKDLVNSSFIRPLEWLCVGRRFLAPLSGKDRVELANFLAKYADDQSIKDAYVFCACTKNRAFEPANSKITELLNLMVRQKGIEIGQIESKKFEKVKYRTSRLPFYKRHLQEDRFPIYKRNGK